MNQIAIEKYILYNKSISDDRTTEILTLIDNAKKRAIYESTPEWRMRSKLRKEISNHICENCGKPKKKLHVHHITYDRYGCELWEDLKILCVPCHKEFHKTYPHHNRHFAKTKVVKQTNMDYPIQDFFT